MKKKTTFIYTILLGSSLLFCPLCLKAQGKGPVITEEKKKPLSTRALPLA